MIHIIQSLFVTLSLISLTLMSGCLEARRIALRDSSQDSSRDSSREFYPDLDADSSSRVAPDDSISPHAPQPQTSTVTPVELSEDDVSEVITRELSVALRDDPSPLMNDLRRLTVESESDCPSLTQQEVDGTLVTLIEADCERSDGVSVSGLLTLSESAESAEGESEDGLFTSIGVYGDAFLITDTEGRQLGISGGFEIIRELTEDERSLFIYRDGVYFQDPHFMGSSPQETNSGHSSQEVRRDLSLWWTAEGEAHLEVNGVWLVSEFGEDTHQVSALRLNGFTLSLSPEGELTATGEIQLRGGDHAWRTLTLDQSDDELSCGRLEGAQTQDTFCVNLSALQSALNPSAGDHHEN